jgi:DNA invertase Pin-like site-specific DNA recombinase
VFAELERAMIRERTRAALELKRRRNERTGALPYGFNVADGKLIENAAEQAVLRQIKLDHAAGVPLRAIAKKLNLAGLPAKRGGSWRSSSVASVLGRKT